MFNVVYLSKRRLRGLHLVDDFRVLPQAVTYSILANTLLVLFVPLFTAKEVKTTKEGDLDPEAKAPFENSALATIFNVVRYLTFLGLYIGFGAVCVGVFKYEPPAGVWSTIDSQLIFGYMF